MFLELDPVFSLACRLFPHSCDPHGKLLHQHRPMLCTGTAASLIIPVAVLCCAQGSLQSVDQLDGLIPLLQAQDESPGDTPATLCAQHYQGACLPSILLSACYASLPLPAHAELCKLISNMQLNNTVGLRSLAQVRAVRFLCMLTSFRYRHSGHALHSRVWPVLPPCVHFLHPVPGFITFQRIKACAVVL